MVKVREEHPIHDDGSVNIDAWLSRFDQDANVKDIEQIRLACSTSKQAELEASSEKNIWVEGASSFRTGLEMAQILAELNLDQESIIAAILYRGVREHKLSLKTVKEQFGNHIAKLIEGVLGMAVISSLQMHNRNKVLGQEQGQLDKVRKMLVSVIDDVRVALIKLAERTCAIRVVKHADKDKRRRVAQEVFNIYAPLAHRLGIGYIKWELEDLSFRYLKPQDYKKIARLLDERRVDREQYIADSVKKLHSSLAEAGIAADISGRAKHIYSIWRKMRRKGIEFREVYDVRAVRVLVPEVRDCYATLGIIHSLWQHIPKEFDDYIAIPKENGYRSLHTAVIGPDGKTLEVQIRTHKMHEEAEKGVCAHWLYKGTDISPASDSYEEKLAWLRQVLEWHEEIGDMDSLADQLRADIEPDRIYAFTKDGHVVDLPVGATPIDFAFRIHTEVGSKCRGAKVGGRIVPLNHTLKTGDQIEILTAPGAVPSRDWLNPNLGYVTTSRARAKITHWFKEQDREQNILAGRAQLEREFRRLALNLDNYDELAKQVNYQLAEDMFAAVGAGDLKPNHVINAAQKLVEPKDVKEFELKTRPSQHSKVINSDVTVSGVGNLLTQMAGCCHPLPGDDIVGYITVGRGVTIHRQDCQTALQLQEKESERLIAVDWGIEQENIYPVNVLIKAYDRSGLLRDITIVLANEKVNVLAVNTQSDKDDNQALMRLTIEVSGLQALGRVLAKINQVSNVVEVVRDKQL